jgi:ADP-ribose pyrophosphatase YjhB (NUDIX family)
MDDMTIKSERSLCFLIKNDTICLSKKLQRLGSGKYNGYGGGLEETESPEQAAIRELKEESTVDAYIKDLEKRAVINFYFPHESHNNQRVHVYFLKEWDGTPDKTEEMDKPIWFSMNNLPYNQMWASDEEWLHYLIEGKKIKAEFVWTKDRQVARRQIDIVDSFD